MDGAEEQQKLGQRELPLPGSPPFLLCHEDSASWNLLCCPPCTREAHFWVSRCYSFPLKCPGQPGWNEDRHLPPIGLASPKAAFTRKPTGTAETLISPEFEDPLFWPRPLLSPIGPALWKRISKIPLRSQGFPGGASGKEPAYHCRRHKRCWFNPWVRKMPWRKAWQSTPVFLSGESPRTEEPGGLQSIRSQRVRCDWSDLARPEVSDTPQGTRFNLQWVSGNWAALAPPLPHPCTTSEAIPTHHKVVSTRRELLSLAIQSQHMSYLSTWRLTLEGSTLGFSHSICGQCMK